MRGLAAVAVLLHHIGSWQGPAFLAPNAGIAVDFFFALSGFVLCHAYGDRVAKGLGFRDFARIRIIRLLPIAIIGTLISLSYLAFKLALGHDATIEPQFLAFAALLGMLSLPYFNAPQNIGGPEVFPLNGPQYTLFFELFVNAFWLIFRRLDSFWPAVGIFVIGFAITGIFGRAGHETVDFYTGFPRVLACYYGGVAIYHGQRRFNIARPPANDRIFLIVTLLAAVLVFYPEQVPLWVRWVWTLVFPSLVIFFGSYVVLKGRAEWFAMRCGKMSYPLYILHFPMWMWLNGVTQVALGEGSQASLIVAPLVLTVISISVSLYAEDKVNGFVRRYVLRKK